MFTQCEARITQAYDRHNKTWAGFDISFTVYIKVISLIEEASWSSPRMQSYCKEEKATMSLISWYSGRLGRVARSSSAAGRDQAAADGDDESSLRKTVSERNSVRTTRLASLASRSTTSPCSSSCGLPWCPRRLGSILVLMLRCEG